MGKGGERISLHNSENKTANKISDVIEKQRGAKITRYGAPGTFSTLSIRGANPNQTGVYLDGLPLNGSSGAPVNLENLPLELFQSLDFYRSYTPLRLPGMHIGGAIDLVPRTLGTQQSLWFINSHASTLGGGALGLGLVLDSAWQYVRLEGSQNRYDYYDDNGTTLFNESDDRIRKRQNEDHYAYGYSGLFRLDLQGDKQRQPQAPQPQAHSFKFLIDLWGKERGLPGPIGSPLEKVRLKEEQGVLQAAHRVSFGQYMLLDSSLGFKLDTSQVSDPEEELSYALVEQKRQSTSGNINIAPIFYFFDDRLSIQALANASQTQVKMDSKKLARRTAQDLGIGLTYKQPGWAQFLWQAKTLQAQDKPQEALDNSILLTSRGEPKEYKLYSSNVRLGIFVWELLQKALGFYSQENNRERTNNRDKANKKSKLELYAALGQSARLPGLTEAYGNGSSIVGNPELKAEQARTQSYGIEAQLASQSLRLKFSGAYFQTKSEDLILFIPNSPRTVRASNAEEAVLSGYEMELDLEWQNYLLNKIRFTQLDAKDTHEESPFKDHYLPLRPRYAVEYYLESGTEQWRPFANLHWLGALYRDRQNSERKFVPQRARYDIGLNYYFSAAQKSRLALIVKNILDEYHSDVLGYPLPDRTYEIQYYHEFY